MGVNYYEVFGVAHDATEKEIVKAYRKAALTCHPDKNPDNPKAAELFIKLSEALEVLTDPSARAAFDKVLKAKEAAKLRTQAFDAKRKKFKDDLEARERDAENEKVSEEEAAELLAAKIKKLREEGSRILEEQQELLRKKLAEEKLQNESQTSSKLKVKWTSSKKDHQNGGYNDELLHKLFSKYGHVTTVLVSPKKNGLAIVEYSDVKHAKLAFAFEKGLQQNPLTLSWIEKPSDHSKASNSNEDIKNNGSIPTPSAPEPQQQVSSNEDFEALVLRRMREAQEQKRNLQNKV